MGNTAFAAFFLLSLSAPGFAAGTDDVLLALSGLCQGIQTIIPVASMLLTVIAAVIYAGGQVLGAETRARANVWATAALTGAMIGVLIAAVGPPVLQTIYGSSINCGGANAPMACYSDPDCGAGNICCCSGSCGGGSCHPVGFTCPATCPPPC